MLIDKGETMRIRIGLAIALACMLAGTAFAASAKQGPPPAWTPVVSSCGASTVTGSQGPVTGPGTPPAGVGSYRFAIGANGDTYRTLRSNYLAGTSLTGLTVLTYYTYVTSFGSGGQAPYIDLRVDLNGDGTPDDILTFEPIYQTGGYSGDAVPNQGAVALNTWQSWNAVVGGWWSENAGNSGPPLVTLAHYAADHPGTRITSIRLATGCGGAAWANFVGYLDKVTIGANGSTRVFDFEPVAVKPKPQQKPRQEHKTALCHRGHTIRVDNHAVAAHLRHGDTLGPCHG